MRRATFWEYIAASANSIRPSIDSPRPEYDTPTLAVIVISTSSTTIGSSSTRTSRSPHELGLVGVGDVVAQHHELVASPPSHDIPRPHDAPEPLGHDDQHMVARCVTVEVVDRLEVIEIDVDDGERRMIWVAASLVQQPFELVTVRETGERIDEGGTAQGLCLALARQRDGGEMGRSIEHLDRPRQRVSRLRGPHDDHGDGLHGRRGVYRHHPRGSPGSGGERQGEALVGGHRPLDRRVDEGHMRLTPCGRRGRCAPGQVHRRAVTAQVGIDDRRDGGDEMVQVGISGDETQQVIDRDPVRDLPDDEEHPLDAVDVEENVPSAFGRDPTAVSGGDPEQ